MKIVMSVSASPGYIKTYAKCINSQKSYCAKYGYDHIITDGPWPERSKEWTWNKHFTLDQFENSHDIFIGIDADIEIKQSTPPIESILNDNSIYYVNGISGRPNAGFLIYKNDEVRKYFHTQLKKRRPLPLPNQNMNAKTGGDNGHVIWILSEINSGLQELPLKWNCSQPEYADDAYLLHYTNKLRSYYTK